MRDHAIEGRRMKVAGGAKVTAVAVEITRSHHWIAANSFRVRLAAFALVVIGGDAVFVAMFVAYFISLRRHGNTLI